MIEKTYDNGKLARVWLVATVIFGVWTGWAAAATRPETTTDADYQAMSQEISSLIEEQMGKKEVTGLSIALVDDQKIVWSAGFGFADEVNRVPARPETIYRAGSIANLFTATAVMQLAEQSKLDIDKPLKTYLPEFSVKSRFAGDGSISPRTIMTHHSGLPAELFKGMFASNPEPFENILEKIKDNYVTSPPNTVMSYSNLGVSLLGIALERITGQAYASYMDTAILSPIGMSHSSFSQSPDPSPLSSKGYQQGEEGIELPLRDLPAAGLNTSVLDLSRFMQMIFANGRAGERQIIKAETLAEMLRPQNSHVPLDLDERIGLAWFLPSTLFDNGCRVASHGGATLCHRSRLIVLPEHKLGVVILANSATAGSLVGKVAIETLKQALVVKSNIKQPEEKKVELAEVALPPETLQTYKGRYDTPMGPVKIDSKSDQLQVEVMNKTLGLIARTDGRCYLQYKLLGLIPINLRDLNDLGFSRATIAGRDIIKVSEKGREALFGERIELVPISAQWSGRTGQYEAVNADRGVDRVKDVRLDLEDGLLIIKDAPPYFDNVINRVAIKPVSETEAVIYGLGNDRGDTIQVVNRDGQEYIQYSGYLLRKKQG